MIGIFSVFNVFFYLEDIGLMEIRANKIPGVVGSLGWAEPYLSHGL